MPDTVTTADQLAALYDAPLPNALSKQTDRLIPEYRAMIDAAPFCILATVGPNGVDVSPRGDDPGFVKIADDHTVLLPDRKGNNRLDSLTNILHDPRVSLLFLIPGVGETLRVAGTAQISTRPDLLDRFAVNGKPPATVLVITVERVYFQCAKALMRSRLWDPKAHVDRRSLPSVGAMLVATKALSADEVEDYEARLPGRLRETLY